MRAIYLGDDLKTGKPVYIPKSAFATHVHMPGATGKGKTTAILAMLHQFLRDLRNPACHFIVDFLGGLSFELLLWMASRSCPEEVRKRLVYICPSREDVVMGFNPLLFDSPAHAYYKCARATELILRGWESQNIEAMPRLARWCFNSFHAVQQLGLTISDSVHLLLPRSDWHQRMLDALPSQLKAEWLELSGSRSSEVIRTLDSTRNRLQPFFAFEILSSTFGSARNFVDMERFMREKKIVILDLSPQGRLTPQLADTFAGLFFNELLTTARCLPPTERHETYCWLDEFQRMIMGPDIVYAIPEVRQLKIRLILAHQSFSQLEQGDVDLTSIIWQPQTRLMFGNQGLDADILAHELASLTYDPHRIKHEIHSRRQLVTDHRIIDLASWSNTQSFSNQWQDRYGSNWGGSSTSVQGVVQSEAQSSGQSRQHGYAGSEGESYSQAHHQQLLPVYDQFLELSSRTYYTFDENKQEWARDVRKLQTGHTVLKLVDEDDLAFVKVHESKPGALRFAIETIYRKFPELIEAHERLIEENFAQREFFVSPAEIEHERQERLERVLLPKITIQSETSRKAPFA